MKNMNKFKAIQLLIFVFITAASFVLIVGDSNTRNHIARDSRFMIVCGILWVVLILTFLFLFIDYQLFSRFRKNVKKLDLAAHADTITGIPNRFSCDSLIEKYIGEPLPPHIGCVMIDITNIIDINNRFGRAEGDAAIKQFSESLHLVSAGLCFIGRNGGNKFIALFENCQEDQLNKFTERLNQQMHITNIQNDAPNIKYKYGIAYYGGEQGDDDMEITDLIAQANTRIYKSED